MSKQIEEQLKILKKRGTPDTDPRVQGLRRRLSLEKQAISSGQEVSQSLKTVLRELIKDA